MNTAKKPAQPLRLDVTDVKPSKSPRIHTDIRAGIKQKVTE